MVNTKKYGDEHFQPQQGGMNVRPSAGPLPVGATYVSPEASKQEMLTMWRSLAGQDPETVGEGIYRERRDELRARLAQVGVDVTKL